MRFFYAVVLFAVSLAFFAGSLVIRNFFSAPDTLTQTITLTGDAPVTIIDAKELRRVAGTETIVASTSVTYKPISSLHESLTLYWYEGGRKLHKLTGARGTASVRIGAGGLAVALS